MCGHFYLENIGSFSDAVNEGTDSTYRVAAAFTQFAGGTTKYFGTYHAEFPKPKRDPA